MKIENIYFNDIEITFLIGKNAQDNFDILNNSNSTDIWFHAKDYPSCHVIACIPNKLDKKTMKSVIKKGCLLCKENTNKLCSIKNLKIIYTEVSNIKKTKILGTVNVVNKKEYVLK